MKLGRTLHKNRKQLTVNMIFGLVAQRYNKLPIKLLYIAGSAMSALSCTENFSFEVPTGL